MLEYLKIKIIYNINIMDELFFIRARNQIIMVKECLHENIKQNENIVKKEKKLRSNYKYIEGSKQHYKDTNYGMNYYKEHKKTIRCVNCNSPISVFGMKRHMTTIKCLNNIV